MGTGTGSVAFVFVSSIVARITYMNGDSGGNTNVYLNYGCGDKLGLSNDIVSIEDVYSAREGTALVNPDNATVNATYDTYDPIAACDGSTDFDIWYQIRKAP